MNRLTKPTNVLGLLLISVLVYLPLMNTIGFTNDDWYLMYAARAAGPGVFHLIYSVDRPLRAYVLGPEYQLFGQHVGFYNLSALLFRFLSAVFLLWLLNRIWPHHRQRNFLATVLYIIYPGFLSQHNGIDYQSQMISLAMAMLSLALTVYVFFETRPIYKFAAFGVAMASGVIYLGLVEYEVGFEATRLALLWILAGQTANNFWNRLWKSLKLWLPYSLIMLGFGVWRIFFFHSNRSATDVNIQFEQARLYPIQIAYHWAIQVIQDSFDVTLGAWITPLSQLIGYIQRWGGILAIGITILIIILFSKARDDESNFDSSDPNLEAILLGTVTIIGGLLPIAMVNRDVMFPYYSRYALVSSVGVAIVIASVLTNLRTPLIRNGLLAGICLIAILTHHANSVKAAQATAATNTFWWQVSWRVPQFEPGTTLMASYPNIILEEDYFIWGPASLIYYPQSQSGNKNFIQPYLYAFLLNQDTVTNVLSEEKQQYDKRRGIVTYANPRNILILSQPSPSSCVHIIDGDSPEYSSNESDAVRLIGSHSEIDHVLANDALHTPPAVVFGPEPLHGWCYYYEQADLARQRSDWPEILNIGQHVFDQGLTPKDQIEWIPFLQAYAQAGNSTRLTKIASMIGTESETSQQACRILGSTPELSVDMSKTIISLFCKK